MANHPHVRGANSELPSQFRIADSGFGALANVEDVQSRELGHDVPLSVGVLASASVSGMSVSHVVGVAKPFKVIDSVIRPIEVFVVDGFGQVRSGSEESYGDEPVNSDENLRTTTAEVEAWISGAKRGGEDAPTRTATVAFDSVQTTDAPKVRDFVETFISDNREPSFCGRILLSHWTSLSGLWSELRQAFARPAARSISGEFYHA